MSIEHYTLSTHDPSNLQDKDPLHADSWVCEALGHLLQHEVDGDVLLKGHGGEVFLKAAYCTAAWSKVF